MVSRNIIKKSLIAIFSVTVALCALLPTLLSVSAIQKMIFSFVEKSYGYRITCQNASLGWSSGVKVEDLFVESSGELRKASIGKLSVEQPLYRYLISPANVGSLIVDNFQIELQMKEPGKPQVLVSGEQKKQKKRTTGPRVVREERQISTPHEQKTSLILPSFTGSIAVSRGNVVLVQEDGKVSTSLNDIMGRVDATKEKTDVTFRSRVSGHTTSSGAPLAVTASLDGKTLFQDLQGNVKVEIENFPSIMVEGFSSLFFPEILPYIRPVIGQFCSAKLDAEIAHDAVRVSSNIISDNLKSSLNFVVTPNGLKIEKSKLVDIKVSQDLLKAVLGKDDVVLTQPVQMTLALDTPLTYSTLEKKYTSPFQISLQHSPAFFFVYEKKKKFVAQASLKVLGEDNAERAIASFSLGTEVDPKVIDANLTTKLLGDNKASLDFHIAGKPFKWISDVTQYPVATLFGDTLDTKVHIDGALGKEGVTYQGSYTSSTENSSKSGFLKGSDKEVVIYDAQADAFLTYDAVLKAAQLLQSEYPHLPKSGIHIAARCPSLAVPFGKNFLDTLYDTSADYSLSISADPIGATPSTNLDFTLRKKSKNWPIEGNLRCTSAPKDGSEKSVKVQFPFQIDASKSSISGSSLVQIFSKDTVRDCITGQWSADFTDKSPKVSFDVSSGKLSIVELVRYTGQDSLRKLEPFVGEEIQKISANLFFRGIESVENQFDLTVASDLCFVEAHIATKEPGVLFSGKQPLLKIHGMASQELFDVIFPKANFSVIPQDTSAALSYDFSVTDVEVPFGRFLRDSSPAGCKRALAATKANFVLELPGVLLQEQRASYPIAPLTVEGRFIGSKGSFVGKVFSKKSEASPNIHADINIQLPLAQEANDLSEVLQQSSGNLDLGIDEVHPAIFSSALGYKENVFEEVFGSKLALSIEGSLRPNSMGSFSSSFKSKNCNALCIGSIRNGVFYPSEPIRANIVMTQRTGELLLKEVSPILSSATFSEQPLSLTIPQENVQIPVLPFSVQRMYIPKGIIALGKLDLRDTGVLKTVLTLLRAKTEKDGRIQVWSTPAYFSLLNGTVTCERADILVGRDIHMATWGHVDLLRDTIAMNILVPNEALHRLGFQPLSTHGLIIPVYGKTSDPKIDTARLTTKLTALGMRNTTVNPTTQLLSGLLEVAASVGQDTTDVPPPTTRPFPWEVK